MRKLGLLLVCAVLHGQVETARWKDPVTNTAVVDVLWRDPGDVANLDLQGGPGGRHGAPSPPFTFRERDDSGTAPKLVVTDAGGRIWSVKWGPETRAEVFATRLLWAVGYLVEPSYFVPSGKIDSVGDIGDRAEQAINRLNGNSFRDARFELRDSSQFPPAVGTWAWNDVPFAGSQELNGLKIMLMLVSDWDNKSGNRTVAEIRRPDGSRERRYIINDWGGAMGSWGGVFTRSKWNCSDYERQSPRFVKGLENGEVRWGFTGRDTPTIAGGITASDVAWLLQYLGRVSDEQILSALEASGADRDEIECYSRAVRSRISQLQGVGTPDSLKPVSAVSRQMK